MEGEVSQVEEKCPEDGGGQGKCVLKMARGLNMDAQSGKTEAETASGQSKSIPPFFPDTQPSYIFQPPCKLSVAI